MGDWLILLLLVPAIVAPVVLLFGFAGCKFEVGGLGPSVAFDSADGTGPNTIALTWSYDGTSLVSFNFARVKLPDRIETGAFSATATPASDGSRVVQSTNDPDVLEPATSYEYTMEGVFTSGDPYGPFGPVVGTTLAAPPPAFDISFLSNAENTANQLSYTFSSVGFGAEDATRRIIVAIAGRDSGTADLIISSVTIGGIAAAEAVSAVSNGRRAALYIASLPTGASGDIVIQFEATSRFCTIGVWRAINLASDTPTATATQIALAAATRVEASLTIPAGGGGLGYIAWNAAGMGGAPPTWTWAGLAEDFDVAIEGDTGSSGARSLTAGTDTRAATASGNLGMTGGVLVLAAWGSA